MAYPGEDSMPFLTEEFHAACSVKGADKEEEGNTDSGHHDAKPFKLVLSGHVGHSKDRLVGVRKQKEEPRASRQVAY
jgi:hypothetical protein